MLAININDVGIIMNNRNYSRNTKAYKKAKAGATNIEIILCFIAIAVMSIALAYLGGSEQSIKDIKKTEKIELVNNSKAELIESAVELIKKEEGFRSEVYIDSLGKSTVGYGQRVSNKNITVTKKEAEELLENEVLVIDDKLKQYPFYIRQDNEKKAVLLSMAYQLGVNGLLKFKNMIRALERKKYLSAKFYALDSLWYLQTPERAKRHAEVLGKV